MLNLNKVAELLIDKDTADILVGDVRAAATAEFVDRMWVNMQFNQPITIEHYKEMVEAAFAAGVEVGAKQLITLLLQHLRDDLKARTAHDYR